MQLKGIKQGHTAFGKMGEGFGAEFWRMNKSNGGEWDKNSSMCKCPNADSVHRTEREIVSVFNLHHKKWEADSSEGRLRWKELAASRIESLRRPASQ